MLQQLRRESTQKSFPLVRWSVQLGDSSPVSHRVKTGLLQQESGRVMAIENLLSQQEYQLVNGEEEKVLWKMSADSYKDCFNSKKTWEKLRTVSPVVNWSEAVWFKHSTPKYSFFHLVSHPK